MSANSECGKDSYLFAQKLIEETNTDTQMKEEMNKIKAELDEMPCDLPSKSQKGGGYTLTAEQQVTAIAWAGRLFTILKLGGYLYNISDAYSLQCAAPHWVAGYFGLGDGGYCASKAAILKETIVQLTVLELHGLPQKVRKRRLPLREEKENQKEPESPRNQEKVKRDERGENLENQEEINNFLGQRV